MCPPCKILLDHPGALAASARYIGTMFEDHRQVRAAAGYLADIAEWSGKAILLAVERGVIADGSDAMDEAHAMSELGCHRASWLRDLAYDKYMNDYDARSTTAHALLNWAEELRLHTTKLIGGEYAGVWKIDGVNNISKAE